MKKAVKKNTEKRKTTWSRPMRVKLNGQQQPSNTAEYRVENGRHLITLNLGDGVFTALRLLAHVTDKPSPEDYVLTTVCQDTASMLTQITEAEAEKFVRSAAIESPREQTGTHAIVLKLPERAFVILAGLASAGGYESPEHMIIAHEASLAAQSPEDQDEKEYARLFGLSVDRNGNTKLS